MEKIILDTDIGSDIDDAVCLAYLLKQPKCDLLGITTVSGEPEKRAMMASVLCKVVGKDGIPIYPGIENPLVTPIVQPKAQQAKLLDRWAHDKKLPKGEAIEFLRRTIRENPGEITLLAIGPMTNIAALFIIDPEIPSLLKDLILMCGVFSYKLHNNIILTEWNALNDPYATKIVYEAKAKRIRSIGLDVTMKVIMDKQECKDSFTADIMEPVFDFAGVWFENADHIVFHDPLAATTIFDDKICRFEKGDIQVETNSHFLGGLTKFSSSADGINEVAVDVDSNLFFKHFFDVVGR